jgi:hypothetical protein
MQSELIDLINTWIEPVYWVDPRHEVRDAEQLAELIASIRKNGWTGAPVVVHGATAFTGAHRIAAIEALRGEGVEIDIPTVDIADVCNVCDVDWEAHCEEWDGLTYDRDRMIADKLPAEIVEYYGLDLH